MKNHVCHGVGALVVGEGRDHRARCPRAVGAEAADRLGHRREPRGGEAVGGDLGLDMIVMGSRGYGPIRRTLLGSTGSHVLHQARCPVLLLPRGTRTSALGADPANVAPARTTIVDEAAVR